MDLFSTKRLFNEYPFSSKDGASRVTVARVADPERQNFDFGTFPGSMD